MPVSLITIGVPIVLKSSASIFALSTTIATPIIIGAKYIIHQFSSSDEGILTADQKASLERQNAILQNRCDVVNALTTQTLGHAETAIETAIALEAEQNTAAAHLLEATKQVVHASDVLASVHETQQKQDSSLHAQLSQQTAVLTHVSEMVPEQINSFTQQLQDNLALLSAMRERMSFLQHETEKKTSLLQTVLLQLTSLAKTNQDQAKTIAELQQEKTSLLEHIKTLSDELALLTSPAPKPNTLTTNSVPTFFN